MMHGDVGLEPAALERRDADDATEERTGVVAGAVAGIEHSHRRERRPVLSGAAEMISAAIGGVRS